MKRARGQTSRIASSIRVTPTPVNSAVSVGWTRRPPRRTRREVVDLIRLGRAHRVTERALAPAGVSLVQREAVAQVLDPVELLRRGPPDHPVHVIALLQQQLRQIRAVLSGDPRNQRGALVRHGAAPYRSDPRRAARTGARTPPRTAGYNGRTAATAVWARASAGTTTPARCAPSTVAPAGRGPHGSQTPRPLRSATRPADADASGASTAPAGLPRPNPHHLRPRRVHAIQQSPSSSRVSGVNGGDAPPTSRTPG